MKGRAVVVVLLFVASACATSKRGSETPASKSVPTEDAAPAGAAPPPAVAPATPQPSQPGAGYGAAPSGLSAAMAQASGEVEAAQRELDVAAGDCRNACRALRSMDRATGRLCSLGVSTEEIRRCSDAKSRLLHARDKVRSTCGTCPDGPSLDRNAPVPSP
jgi:hypothetical protein